MIARFKISFTEQTDVSFINPDTMRQESYKCWYGKGTSLEVADLISGNTHHIFALCTDRELVMVDSKSVRIESINQGK